jgi:hypothetical protein
LKKFKIAQNAIEEKAKKYKPISAIIISFASV